jgi:hypothetical protein
MSAGPLPLDISPTALIPAVSLAAAGLALLGQWRTFSTLGQRRYRDLDERTKAVAFWSAWITAQKAAPDAGLDERLAKAREALDDLVTPPGAAAGAGIAPVLIDQPPLVRHLLLFERPHRARTWPFQVSFYLALAAGVAFVAILALELRGNVTAERIETFAAIVAVVLLLVASLRQLALLVDGRGVKAPAAARKAR